MVTLTVLIRMRPHLRPGPGGEDRQTSLQQIQTLGNLVPSSFLRALRSFFPFWNVLPPSMCPAHSRSLFSALTKAMRMGFGEAVRLEIPEHNGA